jgi:hypothetical protein
VGENESEKKGTGDRKRRIRGGHTELYGRSRNEKEELEEKGRLKVRKKEDNMNERVMGG